MDVSLGFRVASESILQHGVCHSVDRKIPFPEVILDCESIYPLEIEGLIARQDSGNPLFLMPSQGEEMAFEFVTELLNEDHIPLVKGEIIVLPFPIEKTVTDGPSNQIEIHLLPFRDGGDGHQEWIGMDSLNNLLHFGHRMWRMCE